MEEGRDPLADALAQSWNDRGDALQSQGRLEEALACYAEAAEVRQSLVESARTGLTQRLASVLASKGDVLKRLNREEEALVCYDEAAALRRNGRRPQDLTENSAIKQLLAENNGKKQNDD